MSGQFGTDAEVCYGHFGTSAEMSWVRSVLRPKCLDTGIFISKHVRVRVRFCLSCLLVELYLMKITVFTRWRQK